MTDQELARAMAGDETAFAVLVEPFRGELHLHCYRMLGSVQDAEDALQETLVAAWRGIGTFEGRSSFRAWLYRIATNKSLNAMRAARSRPDATPAGYLEQAPPPGSARERELVATFTDAYERGDVGAVVALLTDDATLTMPSLPFIYQGRAAIAGFLGGICAIHRYRLIPVRANGQPSFGLYVRDDASGACRAHGLLVVTLAGDGVSAITRFLDTGIMGRFGLPRML